MANQIINLVVTDNQAQLSNDWVRTYVGDSKTIELHVADANSAVKDLTGLTPELRGTAINHQTIQATGGISVTNATGGVLTVTLPDAAVALSGMITDMRLRLADKDSNVVSTCAFVVNINPTPGFTEQFPQAVDAISEAVKKLIDTTNSVGNIGDGAQTIIDAKVKDLTKQIDDWKTSTMADSLQQLTTATGSANTAATTANQAAQAAQALVADIPTDPKYRGPVGPAGKDGTGIQLKGSADSVDKLPTTGNTAGDTYLVAGHLYIWKDNAWNDAGQLQGPAGADGKNGLNVWLYNFDRGANQINFYWSDLSPETKTDNVPQVGDAVIDKTGNVYQITQSTNTGDALTGGGTASFGDEIINIKGATGAPGTKGDTGNTGATGPAGPAGESAYQVWLDAGNTGTEADYLASLKGATGPAGKDGTTPDLTPYLKSTDAAATYQTATQVQAALDAKIVPVANETTASSNSATSPTVLYLVPEAS